MKAGWFGLSVLMLAACENPDFSVGANISSGEVRPSLGISDSNVSVVLRP